MSAISLNSVSWRYHLSSNYALKKVTLTIERGEFVAIMGRSGSGKTTLCSIMRGFIPHLYSGVEEGAVLIDGKRSQEYTLGDLSVTVGYISENPSSQLSRIKKSLFEEVIFGLENLGIPRRQMKERGEEALKRVGLWELRERAPASLSGGECQLAVIASTLIMNPKIIILDEPTSQLDPQESKRVLNIVKKLQQEGRSIILVEQKSSLVAEYAERVIVMDRGAVAMDDKPNKVFIRSDLSTYGVAHPPMAQLGLRFRNEVDPSLPSIPVTVDEAERLFDFLRRRRE